MAKVYLTKRANIRCVSAALRLMGIVMKQQLPDGSYVIYKKKGSKNEKIIDYDSHHDERGTGEL